MKTLSIKKAAPSDIESIFKLGSATEEFSVAEKPESGLFWSKKQLFRWIKSKEDLCLVAKIKNQVIGFVLCSYHKPTRKLSIENIFIVKEYRRQKIGKKLIEKVLRWATRKSVEYITCLTRRKDIPFINLMESFGFIKGYEDWIWLEKELTNEFPKKRR